MGRTAEKFRLVLYAERDIPVYGIKNAMSVEVASQRHVRSLPTGECLVRTGLPRQWRGYLAIERWSIGEASGRGRDDAFRNLCTELSRGTKRQIIPAISLSSYLVIF
jgi:hypothetical protein